MKVEVALIPAAGRGTRMRPATNAVPKALLTVADRPSIQWVVEEAVRSGVTEVVMVVDSDAGAMNRAAFRHGRPSPPHAGGRGSFRGTGGSQRLGPCGAGGKGSRRRPPVLRADGR